MSTGYGDYRVVSREEIERQQLDVAQARYDRACEEAAEVERAIRAARKAYGNLDVQLPKPVRVRSTGAAAVEQAAAATEEAAALARADHDAAIGAVRARSMTAAVRLARGFGLPDISPEEVRERKEGRRRAQAAAEAAAATASAAEAARRWATGEPERRTEIERVVARLPEDADCETVGTADKAAHRALTATTPSEYDLAMARLRGVLQGARQDADRRRSARERWKSLRKELDGLEGPEVEEARSRIDEHSPGPEPPPAGMTSLVRAVAAKARADRDRAFALDAVASALADLGYQVNEGFATAVPAEGQVVTLPWSYDHGVTVREREGHLLFNVVRYQGEPGLAVDVAADRQAEQLFCDDYQRLVAAAQRRGLELHLARTDPAGLHPLNQVRPPRERSDAGDGKTRTNTQARER